MLVFEQIGIPYAADVVNFVIPTAILSAANSGLYASGRMLWSLANEKTLPRCFARVNKRGVPQLTITVSMLGGVLALLSSGTARAVVVATGSHTYFGSLAKSLVGSSTQTAFDRGVNSVSMLLIRFMLIMVPVVLLINGFSKGD